MYVFQVLLLCLACSSPVLLEGCTAGDWSSNPSGSDLYLKCVVSHKRHKKLAVAGLG